MAKNIESLDDKLQALDSFLDENKILRVGGRIDGATISFDDRHPIILGKNNHITNLIIRDYHVSNLHASIQTTLSILRQRFWPIDGRSQVCSIIRRCIPCFRANPKLTSYKPGNLPSVRINKRRRFCLHGY